MNILLSNDDGYQAPGLKYLIDGLQDLAEIIAVAPRDNCSGNSNALSLRKTIKVEQVQEKLYAVDGTPADCVHLAVNGMLDFQADVVISGINNGENMGDDPVYSGTVAAALEGRFLPLPCIAVSLEGYRLLHFDTAVKVVRRILYTLETTPLNGAMLLNVNVPDIPYNEIQGFEVTRCGTRTSSQPIIVEEKTAAIGYYRIGLPGQEDDTGRGTDFHAVFKQQGFYYPDYHRHD